MERRIHTYTQLRRYHHTHRTQRLELAALDADVGGDVPVQNQHGNMEGHPMERVVVAQLRHPVDQNGSHILCDIQLVVHARFNLGHFLGSQ